jgi:hypothetical protein
VNCGDSGLEISDFSHPTTPVESASVEFYLDQIAHPRVLNKVILSF